MAEVVSEISLKMNDLSGRVEHFVGALAMSKCWNHGLDCSFPVPFSLSVNA